MTARRLHRQVRTAPPILSEADCGCAQRERVVWLVSTPHHRLSYQGRDVDWEPIGTQHARQLGQGTTACGQPAHTWTNFYERRFQPGAVEACSECSFVLAVARAGRGKQVTGARG